MILSNLLPLTQASPRSQYTNHILQSEYSEVRVIGSGADAVDLNLLERVDDL